MDEAGNLNHTQWEFKYHVVFIQKCRRKVLYGELSRYWGEVFRSLAVQKESRIEEGHLMPDHVHMMIALPAKHAVSQVVAVCLTISPGSRPTGRLLSPAALLRACECELHARTGWLH